MVALVTPIAGAAVAILALASGRNMWQTYSICNIVDDRHSGESCLSISNVASQEGVLRGLQEMPKRDLLYLFLSSESPKDLQPIKGEWNGILLNNNYVLTTVSRILTNSFFGWGRRWNGKAFYDGQVGINRFRSKNDLSKMETEHRFDYSIAPSRIDPTRSSVTLKYSRYQKLFSLWKTMVDELRVLQLPEGSPIEVLICMGCMDWSGGMLNASPFCLWRLKE
eukprot:scaffold5798_cov173-Amphora_coffeaeformis.AAC.5